MAAIPRIVIAARLSFMLYLDEPLVNRVHNASRTLLSRSPFSRNDATFKERKIDVNFFHVWQIRL